MREEVYNSSVKYSGKFNLNDFYKSFKIFLFNQLGFIGVQGRDYYETYYYHKVTPEGLNFIDTTWELTMNFWKEEPKIDWYLTLRILINNYSFVTSAGDLEVDIKGEHEIEEVKEPEIKGTGGKIFSFLGFKPGFLKKEFEKRRVDDAKKLSERNLFKACEGIKSWISQKLTIY